VNSPGLHLWRKVRQLGLELLNADHIGILIVEPGQEAFHAAERIPLRLAVTTRNILFNLVRILE
jgi:hypothetical protein